MGKVNNCLRRGFIVLLSLVVVLSTLFLGVTLFHHGLQLNELEPERNLVLGITVMYFLSAVPLVLSMFGLYGACSLKKWAVIVFSVGMTLACLLLFMFVLLSISFKHRILDDVRDQYKGLQLLNKTIEIYNFHDTQMDLECCGIEVGYQDWGYNIPPSCFCTEDTIEECVQAPKNSSQGAVFIYERPCLPVIIGYIAFVINLLVVGLLVLTLVWILSAALSVVVLYQLFKKEDPTHPVVYSAQAKAENYKTLTDTIEFA